VNTKVDVQVKSWGITGEYSKSDFRAFSEVVLSGFKYAEDRGFTDLVAYLNSVEHYDVSETYLIISGVRDATEEELKIMKYEDDVDAFAEEMSITPYEARTVLPLVDSGKLAIVKKGYVHLNWGSR
jgi:hypothetical protein